MKHTNDKPYILIILMEIKILGQLSVTKKILIYI